MNNFNHEDKEVLSIALVFSVIALILELNLLF